ncbi:MAG: DUF1109 family protein [Alphaproteobacteria bacterium]|nr:DUF1109 family protein [Alphaproteobacteria bacterium]
MRSSESHDSLIRDLGASLRPVRRVASSTRLALVWLAVVAVLGAGLAVAYDMNAMVLRLSSAPDLWLAALGAVLTAVFAAKAAFELGIPGRSRAWALAPLAPALLWIGASGLGCLRTWTAAGVQGTADGRDCLMFIVGFSVPLAGAMLLLLRRTFPLYPALTAALAGLACAAGAAALLNLCHPFDATATDLAVHGMAVILVVIVVALSGRGLLRR